MNVFCFFKYFVIKIYVLIYVDVMFFDEFWVLDDKENKKFLELLEEDICLIEDFLVMCNEVRVYIFFIMGVFLIFYVRKKEIY